MPAKKKISRYTTPKGPEVEFQPGSRRQVLRNRLGITTKREMDRAEYEALIRVQERYLKKITPKTRFTAKLICQMHRDWLGKIYPWAGQYRTVDLQKGTFKWPPSVRVPENMTTFDREVLSSHTPYRAGALENVAQQIAEVHGELLFIHPFREGNGRLARWVAELMCFQAGYPAPDYGFTGQSGNEQQDYYLAAVTRAYVREYEPLAAFFANAIARRLETLS